MGDSYLQALARDLAQTQRLLPSGCLFCVPQARALLADQELTQQQLYAHVLLPVEGGNAAPGEYDTLNDSTVAIIGSHVHTRRGFKDARKVRILLSESREVHHQRVTVLHVIRPLIGGIAVPEDPNELDVATFRRYTAILRSFPENELVFYQLDETVAQVRKICEHQQFANRYEDTLPGLLRDEWEAAVEDIVHGGSFDDDDEEDDDASRSFYDGESARARRRPRPQKTQQSAMQSSHVLQIQQVVECYLMEQLHETLFPLVVASCKTQDATLRVILKRMRLYSPEDFGIHKDLQVFALDARHALLSVQAKKTPLDMLLAFKRCIDRIQDAIMSTLKQRRLDFDSHQLTTDDILDQLLFVIVQVFNETQQNEESVDAFPLVAMLQYISQYHFINSNTTALGFTIANFQVAVEYFLMRGGSSDVAVLEDEDTGAPSVEPWGSSLCEKSFLANLDTIRERLELESETQPASVSPGSSQNQGQKLAILGDWLATYDHDEDGYVDVKNDAPLAAVNYVIMSEEAMPLTELSGGQRFFAVVNAEGALFTWGDRSGGRLGYAMLHGEARRVNHPQRVTALDKQHVVHVACGAFHTLVTDLNGHLYAWGRNDRGQLGLSAPAIEIPTLVESLCGTYVGAVACGEYHSLALASDGQRVFSWGDNTYGQLGRVTRTLAEATLPTPIAQSWTSVAMQTDCTVECTESNDFVRRIAAGRHHSIAVSWNGAVFTWGRGDSGQLGHGSFMDVPEPVQVQALAHEHLAIDSAAAGSTFSLFLTKTTRSSRRTSVFLCGRDPSNESLQLCPQAIFNQAKEEGEKGSSDDDDDVTAISCGEAHYALLRRCGSMRLFHGDPTVSMNLPSVQKMACGASHTLVLLQSHLELSGA